MDEAGVCQSCGEKLVGIDIDPRETENFASSLTKLACQREVKADFVQFQEWLQWHGPFDAVVDGANVSLINQKSFSFFELNSVVNCLRQISPSKQLPLVILHRSRVTGGPAQNPNNEKLIQSWKKSGALYATPAGSNDDWYWLYAAVNGNCLLVTNDEMRDHLFQLLGTSFFPRWKEKHQILPNTGMTSLDSVLTQGMNMKKKHEVEVLSAVVDSIANSVGADTIVDVGAGQGYLAQVLSFQYQLSVVAIDSCSHHGSVTNARAERIKKHYAAQMRKSGSGSRSLNVPKTVTCRVMSADMLKAVNEMLLYEDDVQRPQQIGQSVSQPSHAGLDKRRLPSLCDVDNESSFVLAGLHACGDLSVTMLRTFLECKEVKAVVSIGCCYNLLSEEVCESSASQCGFPMSTGIKSAGLSLGKSSRDLACQSAERWRVMGKDAGLHNFELHAFRAAFQMVLYRYYPEVLITSPAIGRQGKALRRQQQRRNLESSLHPENDDKRAFAMEKDSLFQGISSDETTISDAINSVDKYSLFEKFCKSGLSRLGLKPLPDVNFKEVWEEAAPFAEFIGPYWSLRAALGPLLETLILLDRLLFLQEQGSSVEAVMLPIFDPVLSPRNVAIIAKKRN